MSKPNNSIKQINLPNGQNAEIIPDRLGSGNYVASLPTLTQDVTLATTSDLPTVPTNIVVYENVSTTPTIINALLDMIYPVGSVRLSVNAGEENFMGGTWQRVAQGRAIFGAGTSSETPNGEAYSAGDTKSAGLPDHSHKTTISTPVNRTAGGSYVSVPVVDGAYHEGSFGSTTTLASAYNSIYGNSTTVQPNAYIVYVYQRQP